MYQYVGVRVDRLDADTRWEELADYVVPEEAFTSALEWCKSTEDVTLRKQLTFLHSIAAVVISIGKAEGLARSVLCLPMKDRKISTEQVDAVITLNAKFEAHTNIMQQVGVDCFEGDETKNALHLNIFRERVSVADYDKSLTSEKEGILDKFRGSWTEDVKALAENINKACPVWYPVKHTLLKHADIIKLLLQNPHYNLLAPMCRELRSQLTLIRQVHRSLPMVGPQTLKQAQSACDLGVETVTYTYVLHAITTQLPSIENVLLCEKAVDKLQEEIRPSGVVLTDEIEERLKAVRSGNMIVEAPANVEEPAIVEALANVEHANVEEPVPASANNGKRSLSAMLSAAKRRKVSTV